MNGFLIGVGCGGMFTWLCLWLVRPRVEKIRIPPKLTHKHLHTVAAERMIADFEAFQKTAGLMWSDRHDRGLDSWREYLGRLRREK